MPKKKPVIELYSYGIYAPWDRESKQIPKLLQITTDIPVEPEIEFGYVLKIKKAKGSSITFIMNHPPFRDDEGNVSPPFEGSEFVNSNDWSFFLGDTVWPPYEDKAGIWELITFLDGEEIARKTFKLYSSEND
ncbi:DUF3859 domain-containing protein [Natronoflexus pectinivorans]|uniref:Uncharacterized protein DUF3859 n=1 Tax=Natronoflexus pectinivorans TaxID=682526 RepID=A0A4R2GCJ0_9BACT|nr:DUF3859 domain-containing protein [Natronoflexus pectinivorans]TCO04989.1 uncharacterized protein DUF3859 [Natronoflexus pectinivorans]